MNSTTTFIATYGAIRLSGGRKAPGVFTPLLRAFVLIVVIAILLPIQVAMWIYQAINQKDQETPVPVFDTGRPHRFADSIHELTEDMK